ncbi:MAG: radical SAM family heme chaperone HemW [Gammaproteobacteria bacterium]|nr:radical SAM family heme chaperone HemW [Gammaproteobacteria bacterium]MCF6230031.1 radical SAM family heme chaperone HemW [Gammaproteobacteria bacterium]
MFNFTTLPPLSLYIHIPWCVKKCPYCDFNSHEMGAGLLQGDYIEALLSDLEQELPRIWGRKVVSIFIGGGTPSLFSPESLDLLLSGVRARVNLLADCEITLEANPGTVEAGKFSEFRSVGINRLSIGIQSFNDDMLRRLGRIHGRREAIAAAEQAHDAGFECFNFDLMFGLPGQNIKIAAQDIATAIDLQPAHLSYYQLTLEPNTLFHHQPPVLPVDDAVWAMQQQGQQALAQGGFGQYEVSAYAQNGMQCRHNSNYWQFGDYLGIGAGAHAKISDANQQSITRSWKIKQPAMYLGVASSPAVLGGEQVLGRADAGLEFMMNALRLKAGFNTELFAQHTGLPITQVEGALKRLEQKGLIEWGLNTIKTTEHGWRYLDSVVGEFLE